MRHRPAVALAGLGGNALNAASGPPELVIETRLPGAS
jgi:hypothetical protein